MQGFGALGAAFHAYGVRVGMEKPQAGQPTNGWRKGRATFTTVMQADSFKHVQGSNRQLILYGQAMQG